jgi:hypothetical protein
MARAITLAIAPIRIAPLEALRSFIVCGCAIALIAAGQVFPVFT